ncbi:efflux RND transporter periplasmic adaptor subunit [Gimesia chilikensis]|uniref:efflux RND transporter periplasmic adaptor subunit n=1 Tax=Gimesia chilikensis TaxID=2605989 RepID=UPI0011F05944|nr:efflux RND transporter periplasmic adaptor subunit [Gimesia chilikensis]KAA0139335.1 efflux RND transporter periplasmic adaptor subunit [Gimesia chilikensis]
MDSTSSDEDTAHKAVKSAPQLKWNLLLIVVFLLLCLAGGSAAWWYYSSLMQAARQRSRPPASVTVATARKQKWKQQRTGVGTVRAIQGTELTSELAGKVVEIRFESGKRVEEGKLLVLLDTTRERAELKSIEADLKQARSDLSRSRELLKKDATTEESYEQAATEVEQLQASADRQRAVIEKKEIQAPFSGELGIRKISLGEYLSPGSPVTTLQQIEPIYVDFDLPEQDAGAIAEGQTVRISVDAYSDESFRGKIIAINPLVEETTRSFTVRAQLPNQQRKLRPGMFAEVVVELPEAREVIEVPQTAIALNAYGKSVFFVREEQQQSSEAKSSSVESSSDKKTQKSKTKLVARRAFVQTGERRGHQIEVRKGVQPGDRVVTSGQLKIEDGSPVRIAETDAARDVEVKTTKP